MEKEGYHRAIYHSFLYNTSSHGGRFKSRPSTKVSAIRKAREDRHREKWDRREKEEEEGKEEEDYDQIENEEESKLKINHKNIFEILKMKLKKKENKKWT